MDSGLLRQQDAEQGLKQPFAPYPGVVDELEEAQV